MPLPTTNITKRGGSDDEDLLDQGILALMIVGAVLACVAVLLFLCRDKIRCSVSCSSQKAKLKKAAEAAKRKRAEELEKRRVEQPMEARGGGGQRLGGDGPARRRRPDSGGRPSSGPSQSGYNPMNPYANDGGGGYRAPRRDVNRRGG